MAQEHSTTPDDDGWIAVEDVPGPADRIEFENLDFLAEVTHPTRGRIMRLLKHPLTIAEVAGKLDAPVTRMYHHFDRLVDAGLIQVVATRKVNAVTERRYQVVTTGLAIAPEFFESADPAELSMALGSLFDFAKLGLQREIESSDIPFTADSQDRVLSFGELTLTASRRAELVERLEAVVEEFVSDGDEHDADAIRMALFIAAYAVTR